MAENFADEGLDRILNFVPGGNGTLDTTLYIAVLTTSGTVDGTVALDGTHVPSRTTIWASDYSTSGASGRGGGGEPVIGTGAYARKSIANTIWGSPATNGSGRRLTGSQQSMATSTAAWSPAATIGGAIVTAATAGAGVAYYYANYSDNSTVTVNSSGIVLQLTPFWELDI